MGITHTYIDNEAAKQLLYGSLAKLIWIASQ